MADRIPKVINLKISDMVQITHPPETDDGWIVIGPGIWSPGPRAGATIAATHLSNGQELRDRILQIADGVIVESVNQSRIHALGDCNLPRL